MLNLPDNSPTIFKIIGIDPGTTNLGLAVLSVDINTLNIANTDAHTFNAKKLINKDTWTSDIHSERFVRINALKAALRQQFLFHQPSIVCVESPFFGMKHPNAFQALVEVLNGIRDTLFEYNSWLNLTLVSPSEVKNAINAKGNAGKSNMQENLRLMVHELNLNPQISFESLDEHSIDAIAIAYFAYIQSKNTL